MLLGGSIAASRKADLAAISRCFRISTGPAPAGLVVSVSRTLVAFVRQTAKCGRPLWSLIKRQGRRDRGFALKTFKHERERRV